MKQFLLSLTLLGGLLAAIPVQAQAQEYCREFNTTVTIGGVRQPAWGTSCLQPDGSWQVTSQPQPETATLTPDPAYLPEEQTYLVEEEPVYVSHYVPAPRPQAMWSIGYSNSDWRGHRGYRHGGWGSSVGMGFGHHWH